MEIKRNTLVLLPKKLKYISQKYRLAIVKGKVPQESGRFRVRCIDKTDKFVATPLPLIQVAKQIKEVDQAIEECGDALLEVLIEKLCESLGYGEEES